MTSKIILKSLAFCFLLIGRFFSENIHSARVNLELLKAAQNGKRIKAQISEIIAYTFINFNFRQRK